MRVYLDTCALQRPLDDASQLRVYLETEAILGVIALIEEGAVELLSSEALTYEAARNPYTDRRDYAFTVLARAAAEVPASEPVRLRARNYLGSDIKPLEHCILPLPLKVGQSSSALATTGSASVRTPSTPT